MRIVLIRHGMTAGNIEKRYIGTTDEPLCSEGITELSAAEYPRCELLVSSPMLRCRQTCAALYPSQIPLLCEAMKECDFGDFEGRNYRELSDSADYQKWIDSGGEARFPNGESPRDFRLRCTGAFARILHEHSSAESVAFVVHGGTIMSILEEYALPHRDYYDWHTENGHGYICEWNGRNITVTEKI